MASLTETPVHLGQGARAEPQPQFTGIEWYADYARRTAADGPEGRLVSLHRFDTPWDSWEMHPLGDELVVCTAGRITLIQAGEDGSETQQTLAAGDYAINPPGCWHTADIAPGESASVLFVTAGLGTQHRPR